jgi:hypothetical protein
MSCVAVVRAGERKARSGCSSAAPAPESSGISARTTSKRSCGGPKRYGSAGSDVETESDDDGPMVRSRGADALALCKGVQRRWECAKR